MKQFMNTDFLLNSSLAHDLYYNYAEKLPIIDYHCHLDPGEIARNKQFSNIAELWLAGDHYKWRAMRSCGIGERYITGDASDYDKFRAYASVMPALAGNPLYHWSHLELRRYFGCELIINPANCDRIWEITSEAINSGVFSARNLIARSNVELLCTTDDPADDLKYHKMLSGGSADVVKSTDSFSTKILPAFRPDKGLNIERRGITEYITRLGAANGVEITDFASLKAAYINALDRFAALGCRTADHGFDTRVVCSPSHDYIADGIFRRAISNDGRDITPDELASYKTALMCFLASEYNRRGWVMQLHFGVERNPNSEMFGKIGSDSGFDTMGGESSVTSLKNLLDYLSKYAGLPRTILYPINPGENYPVSALAGSFCGDGSGIPTVIAGCAWWFNDNIDGIREQLRAHANVAALGRHLGMTTDSRSFVSYPRHEYFRRIFCSFLADMAEDGLYPADMGALGGIVRDVCYNNVKKFFGF